MLSTYYISFPDSSDPASIILFSTKNASKVAMTKNLLSDIEQGMLGDEEREQLSDLGLLVDDAAEEKKEMLSYLDGLNSIDHIFASKVVLNLDCNLACRYCFEGQRKGKYYMSRETADSFVEFVRAYAVPRKQEIRLTFYGGEPLLSLGLTEYISERVKSLAGQNGITYSGHIVTNGTLLTPAVAERLTAAGVKEASVTLDGPGDIHDAFRPFKGGKGSFDIIIKNLNEVCKIMDVEVGGNFMKENYHQFPFLLDCLADEGLTPDKLLLVRFDPVTQESDDMAPPGFHGGCGCFNESWLYDAGVYLREEIMKRGYKVHKFMPMTCLMDMADRSVINFDGEIYKCPGLIGRKKFSVGNLRDGVENYRESHNLDNWKNEGCLDCAYLPLCFGGCRYMKLVRDGNMNGVDCKKPFFDATLEAFVKQDIKYGLVSG
jgi:uncharacterized protein